MHISLDYFDDGYIMFIDWDSKEEIGYKYTYDEYKYYIEDKRLNQVTMSSTVFADPDSYPTEYEYQFINKDDKEKVLDAIMEFVKTEGFDSIEYYYKDLNNEIVEERESDER